MCFTVTLPISILKVVHDMKKKICYMYCDEANTESSVFIIFVYSKSLMGVYSVKKKKLSALLQKLNHILR